MAKEVAAGKWRKSPPRLVASFEAAIPDDPRVERRLMFGYPCVFAGGNMFAGLHQDDLFVRLADAERALAVQEHGARPFEPMPGRVMREYVVLPPSIVTDSGKLAGWMAKALAHVGALPVKSRKPAKPTPPKPTRSGK